MFYSTSQTCQIFDISPSTLRNWVEVAAPFLSPNANPEKGKHRSYSSEDLRVLTVLKNARDYEDAYLRLSNGERAEPPASHNDYSIAMKATEQVSLLQTRILQLEAQVELLKDEHDKRVRAEAQVELLRELLKEAQDELAGRSKDE